MNKKLLPESVHFRLEELAEGVFAAIAKPEGMAGCNSGIIDLGDRTAVIDTFLSPAAAKDLCIAAEELTGRPVDLVLITHHHFDHIWGNQAFDDKTCIFSSAETHRMIVERGESDLKATKENTLQMLRDSESRLAAEHDPDKQAEISKTTETIRQRLALIDTIRLRLPSLTCQGPISFHGTLRRIEFIPFEKAHSPGNSVIYLPEDELVFVGDLLFARRHPFLGDGDPQGWVRVLEEVKALKPKTVVPGHGEISTLEEIDLLAEYIRVTSKEVKAFVQAGKPAAALSEIQLPEPFASWEPKELLLRSLNSLYQWYKQ